MKKIIILITIPLLLILSGCTINFSKLNQNKTNNNEMPKTSGNCVTTGCSGELCVEKGQKQDVMTICVFLPEYECFKYTKCEKQENGECAWTRNENYLSCLEDKKYIDGANIEWIEAVQLINDCRVITVSQTHQLKVTLKLKKGITLNTLEPQIDEVIKQVMDTKEKCGSVTIITE